MNEADSQVDNEAKTFVYNFFKTIDPNIANDYKIQSFDNENSLLNLNVTLSNLPNDFFNVLVKSEIPKTDFPSLIYNPKHFINFKDKNNIYEPFKNRLNLITRKLEKMKLTNRIIGHTRSVRNLICDDASLFLITASDDSTIKFWHLNSLSLMFTFKGHQDVIIDISISGDRTLFASISMDKTIRIWSLINGACLDVITDASLVPFHSINFSSQGKLLAVTSEKGRVIVWDLEGFDLEKTCGHHPKHIKTINLQVPVRNSVFSPGGNLIAVTLEQGSLGVFTIYGDFLSTINVCDTLCDFCSFHPNISSLVFAGSSKSGIISLYEIKDQLKLVHEYNSKQIFKRLGQSIFAISCDASLVFCCSSTTLLTWSQSDGNLLSKIENLSNVVAIYPHIDINTIVAIVTKNSVVLANVEIGKVINTMNIPYDCSKLACGVWDNSGVKFYAGDNGGGFYVFRLSSSQLSCCASQYFFPTDFTPSEWDEGRGQYEEDSHVLVHLLERNVLIDSNQNILIPNYVPYIFTDLFISNYQKSSLSVISLYELSILGDKVTKQMEIKAKENDDPSQLVMGIGEEAEALYSDYDSESENEEEKNTYPFWTSLTSTTHGTYFPQIADKVVYIREGHIEMIKNDQSLGVGIFPSFSNEIWWPLIELFQIVSVRFSKLFCEISMKRIQMPRIIHTSIIKKIENYDSLVIADDEPVRVFKYSLSDAPYFLIEARHFKAAFESYDSLSIGDDVVSFYRRNGVETPYPGRVLNKIDNPTRFNSIEVDWGSEEQSDALSPWELYSINTKTIFEFPSLCPEITNKINIIYNILTAAQKVRSLRQLFKQPIFSWKILYPSDFGLVKRRIENNFYRNPLGLEYDIKQVEETQKLLNDVKNVRNAQYLIEILFNAVKDFKNYKKYLDFSGFDDEIERRESLRIHEETIHQRDIEKAKRNLNQNTRKNDYVNFDEIDNDTFGEQDLSEDEYIPSQTKKNKKRSKPRKDDDFISYNQNEMNDDSDFQLTDTDYFDE